ncbi:hypothetical protein QM565_32660 [Geitlerinema splendidum]|nr:hypothetical protein [Geitlerinema splendidum]
MTLKFKLFIIGLLLVFQSFFFSTLLMLGQWHVIMENMSVIMKEKHLSQLYQVLGSGKIRLPLKAFGNAKM